MCYFDSMTNEWLIYPSPHLFVAVEMPLMRRTVTIGFIHMYLSVLRVLFWKPLLLKLKGWTSLC